MESKIKLLRKIEKKKFKILINQIKFKICKIKQKFNKFQNLIQLEKVLINRKISQIIVKIFKIILQKSQNKIKLSLIKQNKTKIIKIYKNKMIKI